MNSAPQRTIASGRTAKSWVGPSPPDSTPSMCESCIVPAPAKPTSPAACRLAAPPCAVSWADLFPGEIGASFWPTQAYRKDTVRLDPSRGVKVVEFATRYAPENLAQH